MREWCGISKVKVSENIAIDANDFIKPKHIKRFKWTKNKMSTVIRKISIVNVNMWELNCKSVFEWCLCIFCEWNKCMAITIKPIKSTLSSEVCAIVCVFYVLKFCLCDKTIQFISYDNIFEFIFRSNFSVRTQLYIAQEDYMLERKTNSFFGGQVNDSCSSNHNQYTNRLIQHNFNMTIILPTIKWNGQSNEAKVKKNWTITNIGIKATPYDPNKDKV